jgi:hypothetical protein
LNVSQSRSIICTIIAAYLVSAGGAPGQDLSDENKSELVFGKSVLMGQVLVGNLKNACRHAYDLAASSSPELRVLLLADREMTAFATEACRGFCDKLQMNNIVVRCRRQSGIKGCVIYGAAFGGRVYSFSIDPTGFNLEKDCEK